MGLWTYSVSGLPQGRFSTKYIMINRGVKVWKSQKK